MSAPCSLSQPTTLIESSHCTPSGWVVVGAEAERQRQVLRPDLAHGVHGLDQEPRSVLLAAAVLVGALVGQRRVEARGEVAVREVHLQPLVAGLGGAHGGLGVLPVDGPDLLHGQRVHRVGPLAEAVGDVRRADDLPALGVVRGQLPAEVPADPRLQLAGVAAGVSQLDAGHPAHVLDHRRDARVPLDLRVGVDPGAVRRGAALGRDRHLLGVDQAEPACGAGAQVHQVEVAHLPGDRRVAGRAPLPHRRMPVAVSPHPSGADHGPRDAVPSPTGNLMSPSIRIGGNTAVRRRGALPLVGVAS